MNNLVRKRVEEGNAWYTDDQRAVQLGTVGARWALQGRWELFGALIDRWLVQEPGFAGSVRVLDAGCGDGINMAVLRDLLGARGHTAEIVGSDYNSLRLARAADGGRYPVLESDLRALPFADGAFDLVMCSHVLEHIRDDVVAMGELARVVTPAGLVLVAVPNEGCAMGWLRNHVLQRSILRTTDHVQFYTAATLVNRARRGGLVLRGGVEREGLMVPHYGVYRRLRESGLGRRAIVAISQFIPSQAAGLVAAFARA
jgi:SAM-dependent methyltransferase